MLLDVVIPTYNRQELLQRTLKSLLGADMAPGLTVRITVVDNNSKDSTRQVIEKWIEKFDDRVRYVFEARQGRSNALNAGIASTDGDLVGMIDDDEGLFILHSRVVMLIS
jgi:glycosyltransferase involved in cell wall biosynthesis